MISGIVTTLNEERNIAECVRSLFLVCDEVIVVDSLSSDRTREIAEQEGARVFVQPYLGDGIQKNVALQYVKNPWVLSIDADERLSPELVHFLQTTDLEHTPYDGFALRRRTHIGGRWVRCCGWYPDYLVRLYRHERLRFAESKQHASVPEGRNTRRVKADLLHYSFANIEELFYKEGRNFISRGAKQIFLRGKHVRWGTPAWHGTMAFLRNYLFKGGILGGSDGLTLSLSKAHNSYMKYARVREWQRDPRALEKEDFTKVW